MPIAVLLAFASIVVDPPAPAAMSPASIAAPAVRERSLDAGGVRIRFIEAGLENGEPVLLVHGFWDSIEVTWASTGVIENLAADHRVLALDCRGHGGSDKPHSPGAYGMNMIEDLARVLDGAGIKRAHIVGHSMGAHLSLRFAVAHPHRVRTLTVIGAGAAPAGGDSAVMERIADSLERDRSFRPLIEFIWPADAPRPTPEEITAIDTEALKTNDPLALAAIAKAYGELSVTDAQARALPMPIFAVTGTNDPMTADVRRLAAAVGEVPITYVQGADHIDIMARPELVEALRLRILNVSKSASRDE